MITVLEIQTAIAKALTTNGFTVIASEVQEGFTKPACFVNILPVSVELQNRFEELVTDSVEIAYFPKLETREELVRVSEKIKNIFLYKPLPVEDRFLSINAITFDAENSTLYAQFNIEFIQETNIEEEKLPPMKTYIERIESNGSSTNSD